jgi:hypothetical protein
MLEINDISIHYFFLTDFVSLCYVPLYEVCIPLTVHITSKHSFRLQAFIKATASWSLLGEILCHLYGIS